MTTSSSPSGTIVESPENRSHENTDSEEFTKDLGFIPIPRRLRYDADKPFHFGIVLNISFGIASTFIVANLYYCQPLLIQFSETFQVSYSEVSRIPTLVQAGYAAGLLFLSPLGDLVRRRQLILCLVTLSTSLTIGLAVTNNLIVFEALSFLVGVVSVTPQILLPLAADLAPPERRASVLSIVLSGLLFGVLLARVLSGVIAEFTSWRVVYYLAIGVQTFVLIGSYLVIPDYPSKNKDLTYWDILWTMAKYSVTEPLLIQASLVNLASSACFANFWVTLTFLLGSPPYNYSTLVIGLFGLIGMFGVAMGPLVGRTIDMLVPWYASLVSVILLMVFQGVQTAAGGIHIAAVVIATLGLDVFRQMVQISLSTAVFSISPEARARLNAVMLLSVRKLALRAPSDAYSSQQLFLGQVMGTAAGTEVFVKHGWRAAAALNMGWYGWQALVLLVRGPHCARYTWFGYEGGIEPRKSVVEGEKNTDAKADDGHDFPPDKETGTEVIPSDKKDATGSTSNEK